jgi:hypothetical protein
VSDKFEVIVVSEGGAYVLSKWDTYERAAEDADKQKQFYNDGQSVVVRQVHSVR